MRQGAIIYFILISSGDVEKTKFIAVGLRTRPPQIQFILLASKWLTGLKVNSYKANAILFLLLTVISFYYILLQRPLYMSHVMHKSCF